MRWQAARHPFASLVWVGADGQRLVLAQDLRGGQAREGEAAGERRDFQGADEVFAVHE